MKLKQVLYTAIAHAEGGRQGRVTSPDGALDVSLSIPKELGGSGGPGTNPEQLFGAGYAACFIGAMRAASSSLGVRVPADVSVMASVDIGPISEGYGIQVAMDISLPGVDRSKAMSLINAAHQVCPYSNATRGNIDIQFRLV